MISNFIDDHSLIRCDELFPNEDRPTYVNLALNQHSRIGYSLYLLPLVARLIISPLLIPL